MTKSLKFMYQGREKENSKLMWIFLKKFLQKEELVSIKSKFLLLVHTNQWSTFKPSLFNFPACKKQKII